jgi:protein phosphatase
MLRAADTIQRTDTGLQRGNNEDSAFARAPVFAVADGMGGAQKGEVASRMAVDVFEQGLPDGGSPQERLVAGAREANRRIHELSLSHPEYEGMGTTLTAACLDGDELAVAHVGDSRAYIFRDGKLRRLTQDHTLVNALLEQGKLTEEQAAEHPQRSIITRALGPEPDVAVDTWSYPLRGGDVILLCSDGLTSMISEKRIESILASTSALDRAADALIADANAAGGRDNITVVVFRVEDVGSAPDADQPTVVEVAAPGRDADGSQTRTMPAAAPPANESAGPAARDEPGRDDDEHPLITMMAPAITAQDRPPAAPPPEPPRPREPVRRARLARRQGPPVGPPPAHRRAPRFAKPLAALVATLIVLFVILAGGWLASRQLYFIGTNAQGALTIYRGLPYDLPAGIKLYETFYVSGVPAADIPADRRSKLLDHHLRSQDDASSLVRDLELGKVVQ